MLSNSEVESLRRIGKEQSAYAHEAFKKAASAVDKGRPMDEIQKIIAAAEEAHAKGLPTKTFSELLAAGVPHKGGLAQLAAAERAGTLFGSSAAPATSSGLPPPKRRPV